MNYVRNSFHLYTLGLIDVLEGIQIPGLFVLNDTDLDDFLSQGKDRTCVLCANLSECTLSYASQQNEVKEVDISIKVNGLKGGENGD